MTYQHPTYRPDFARYAAGKAELERKNLTPEQYQQEIRKLAQKCGI